MFLVTCFNLHAGNHDHDRIKYLWNPREIIILFFSATSASKCLFLFYFIQQTVVYSLSGFIIFFYFNTDINNATLFSIHINTYMLAYG